MNDPTTIILTNSLVEKKFSRLLEKFYDDKGIVGPKGDKGDKGDAGLSIKGDKGDTGVAGPKGDPGKDGLSIKGDKGDPGKDGLSIKGDKGDPGRDGLDGKDGKGINSLVVTEEGSVIAQFTDGSTNNIGKAQVNNITNISGGRGGLPTGFFAVHSVTVEDTKLRIRCNNNKVFEVELPSGGGGTAGPQGPAGPIGPQGIQGEVGPQGIQGPIGLTGNTGPQGIQGPIGPTGPAGPADRASHTGTQLASTISDLGNLALRTITINATAPGSPAVGDIWVDPT